MEASLQQFGEFILKAQLIGEKAAPYGVRWVRRFLTRQAWDESPADQVRTFCEELARDRGSAEWQVRQAEQALGSTSSTASSEPTGSRSSCHGWFVARGAGCGAGKGFRGSFSSRFAVLYTKDATMTAFCIMSWV